jgi:hypothetical protein
MYERVGQYQVPVRALVCFVLALDFCFLGICSRLDIHPAIPKPFRALFPATRWIPVHKHACPYLQIYPPHPIRPVIRPQPHTVATVGALQFSWLTDLALTRQQRLPTFMPTRRPSSPAMSEFARCRCPMSRHLAPWRVLHCALSLLPTADTRPGRAGCWWRT